MGHNGAAGGLVIREDLLQSEDGGSNPKTA